MASEPRAIGRYSAYEVGRLAGVSSRRVGQWARYGLIPSVSQHPRIYSYADAGEAVLVRYLIELGYKPREVRQIVIDLREQYGAWPLATAPLEHDGRFLVLREGDRIYVSAVRSGQRVFEDTLLDLKIVRAALERGGWIGHVTPREHIQVDPERLSGRPTIRGRRIGTDTVAELAKQDELAVLLDDFGLSDDEIDDAVNYEADVNKAIAV